MVYEPKFELYTANSLVYSVKTDKIVHRKIKNLIVINLRFRVIEYHREIQPSFQKIMNLI